MSETGVDVAQIKQIVEAAILAADEPLSVDQLLKLFKRTELNREEGRAAIREALQLITEETQGHGFELKQVASGYRFQIRQEMSQWVSRLWDEKPPRYSRALLETLALVAYKQPVTRGDIEQVRGVTVSQNIMRTMLERGWVRVVGQREVPGRPSMYGTTRAFLDYFNLKSLDQLPPMAEIKALIEPVLIDADLTGQYTQSENTRLILQGAESDENDTDAHPDMQGAVQGDMQRDVQADEVEGAPPDAESVEDAEAADELIATVAEAVPAIVPDDSAHRPSAENVRPSADGPRPSADGLRPSADVVRLPTQPR